MSHTSRTARREGKRQFGSIRKLPSGRYQAHVTEPTGKRVMAPHTFAAKIDAEAWLTDMRRSADKGLWTTPQAQQMTFGDYASTWLVNRQVSGRPIKVRTREHYQRILNDHLLPAFGDRSIGDITAAQVRTWYAETLADCPTMRAHAYSLLKSIMGCAVADELATAQPCRIVGAGRAKRAIKINPATPAELVALAEEMPERLALMVALGSWCGLRFGEIVELRRSDIDLTADVIRVRRAATRTAAGYSVGDPKSDAGRRDVTVPPHIMPQIERHLDRHVGPRRDALLFPADHGGHLRPSTLYRYWYQAREAVGRPDLRFHDLRHSGAVLAAVSGATLAELMDRLGHSTPAAAMRYQHASQSRAREVAALMSKLADT